MKRLTVLFTLFAISSMVLMACAKPADQPATAAPATEAPAAEAPATEAPATEAPATEAPAAEAPATEAPAAIQHTDVPGGLPDEPGKFMYDHHINTARGSIEGDRFSHNKFERPYNNDNLHFPALDISEVRYFNGDPMWFFAVITFIGPDENGVFPGKYALELDTELLGFGNWFIIADSPASAEWSTDGVQVWYDSNSDVGGAEPLYTDNAGMNGDGYETLIFDNGVGDDPDTAWARVSPDYPNSVEIVFKKSMLADPKFMIGVWAGTDDLDPAMFDLSDHYTHAQAGALNPEYTDFYPIKELTELDNTCRQPIGFEPTETLKILLCP
ncbi:MAG: hypothetical protein JXA13_11210 [Anaerolineales bacterium]|nr:hypothetical protein [Anaerolineales bacterium]